MMTRICFLCFILCLISRKESRNKKKKISQLKTTVNNALGTTLQLPKALKTYAPFDNYLKDSTDIANANFKIYTSIDDSCGACIGKIKSWASIAETLNTKNVAIILLCRADQNKFALLEHLCELNLSTKKHQR